ncbi:ParA family protein (plasmid) [Photobacterium damselae subsp. damselae]|uniref:ParA family protein n=1 Tax=Photobacterium damselae TaxID=38293 RepID=UPI00311AF031
MAKYLILMASKGGSGKSVLCKQIARELYRTGHKVSGHDYDPQQHYAQFVEVNGSVFSPDDEADYIIVDTQGAHTKTNIDIMKGMKNEDALFIIPFMPTDDDYKEALKMRDRLKEFDLLDKAVFVANRCYRENDKDAKDFKQRLASTVKVAKSVFVHRKAYAKEPDSKVINEVSRFLNEVVINGSTD